MVSVRYIGASVEADEGGWWRFCRFYLINLLYSFLLAKNIKYCILIIDKEFFLLFFKISAPLPPPHPPLPIPASLELSSLPCSVKTGEQCYIHIQINSQKTNCWSIFMFIGLSHEILKVDFFGPQKYFQDLSLPLYIFLQANVINILFTEIV